MIMITIKCNKCGPLGMYSYDAPHKIVSGIVDKHKLEKGRNHRIYVKRNKY